MENTTNKQEDVTNVDNNELYIKFKELFTDKRLNVFNLQISKKFKDEYPDVYNYIIKEYNIPENLPHEEYKMHLYKAYIGLKEIPICPVCGKNQVGYDRKHRFHMFCSDECRNSEKGKHIMLEKVRLTCLEKYGTTCALQADTVKNKIKQTNLERYGVENVSQSKEIQHKKELTTLSHFGVEHPGQSEIVKNKTKLTNLEKYGVENPFQAEQCKEKSKQTCIEKYGVEYSTQSEEVKEKIKQVCLLKYGVENPNQCQLIRNKAKQTNLERYGVETPIQAELFKEKSKLTCLERYGVEYSALSELMKQRSKETMLEHYGVEHALQNKNIYEKRTETMLERYNVEHAILNDEIKNKILLTNIERYGFKYPPQSKEVYDKIISTNLERYGVENPLQSKEIRDKAKQTILKKYGVENPSQSEEIKQKKIDTVIKHFGSYENWKKHNYEKGKNSCKLNKDKYCMSHPEYETYLFLIKRFGLENIKYNEIIDDRYNFHVDFYIRSLDIFIEINAHWSHNNHLFDSNNINDINEANEWLRKAENHNSYESALNVWTHRDPLKCQTAKDNNLLYIPIWSDNINVIEQEITDFFSVHNLILPEPTYNYTEDEIISYIKEKL